MTRRDTIRSAYRFVGDSATIYDGMMTCSTFLGTAISRIVWKICPEENTAHLERAMAGVPVDFAGSLLEVPVGTGVLTMPLCQGLPDAQVTCLDYSSDMMVTAQAKANAQWAEGHPDIREATWHFHFDDERGGTVAHYHYTRCPINDLARQEGFTEILPVMCETDYYNTGVKHGRLTRKHTLAEGGPYCDFLIEPGE